MKLKSSVIWNFYDEMEIKQESLQKKDYWDSSYTKAIEFDKLIVEIIALQDLPFK
ncbi:hypothetical protein ALC57_17727 [Trachymyrmex cornetzi]|uniref:Uncharacterized protein n=1 Tax=Trachymyrmex cornetzi TaxID=471704 RepID=A0A151IT58_9HYME|nr:hypothetical protein ALC57_17727 [Trachymyrmex cornetzi]